MASGAASRNNRYLADTGYLICFGAIPQGARILSELFGERPQTPKAVRTELLRIANNGSKPPGVRRGAAAYSGAHAGRLVANDLTEADLIERDLVLHYMSSGALPTDPWVAGPGDEATFGAETTGPDAGEAEVIAVATRQMVPVMINERRGTRYARQARRLQTEAAAETLRRLYPAVSAQQLFQMYRRMEQEAGDTGVVVPGPIFFSGARARI